MVTERYLWSSKSCGYRYIPSGPLDVGSAVSWTSQYISTICTSYRHYFCNSFYHLCTSRNPYSCVWHPLKDLTVDVALFQNACTVSVFLPEYLPPLPPLGWLLFVLAFGQELLVHACRTPAFLPDFLIHIAMEEILVQLWIYSAVSFQDWQRKM